jgi:hypothetical protein
MNPPVSIKFKEGEILVLHTDPELESRLVKVGEFFGIPVFTYKPKEKCSCQNK